MNKLFNLLVFISLACFGQKDIKSCEKGTQKALRDFSKKVYVLETLGQVVDNDFYPVLIAYAKQRYNIRLTGADCVIFPEMDCYGRTMRTKVLKKFGSDIETRMKAEALTVFKKTDKYLTEIKPKIDTGFVFASGHTNAEYKAGETGFRAFLCNNIKDTQKAYWTSFVSFIVEKDGSVSNLDFTKEPVSTEVKSEVERLFLLMGKWAPATYYGENIRTKVSHSISSKKNMEMMDDMRAKSALEWKEKRKKKQRK